MQNMYVVAYDVGSDRHRGRVFDLLSGVGEWLQYSVFRCPLDATALARLTAQLAEYVDGPNDQILFFDMGPADGRGANPAALIGRPLSPVRRTAIII